MEPIPIRIHEKTKDALESEAADRNVSVSAYTRAMIERGRDFETHENGDILKRFTNSVGAQRKVSQLRAMTLRVEPETKDRLEAETADSETGLSEHIRDLIAKGRAQESIAAEAEEGATSPDERSNTGATSGVGNQQAETQSDTDAVTVEVEIPPATKQWLEEQTTDSGESMSAYIRQLIATARNSADTYDSGGDQTDTVPESRSLQARVDDLEAAYDALRDQREDTQQTIAELTERVAAIEARVE